jgi:hypothetical protein
MSSQKSEKEGNAKRRAILTLKSTFNHLFRTNSCQPDLIDQLYQE